MDTSSLTSGARSPVNATRTRREIRDVALVFCKLGLTSFGGPIAHIGYYRREFVERRGWLNENHFYQLLALCQFLPGPASSQMCFSIGLLRASWIGGIVAIVAFTMPSAFMLYAFALWSGNLNHVSGIALIHGLKLLAIAVVGQGLLDMIRHSLPDFSRSLLAIFAVAVMALWTGSLAQLAIILIGAVSGPFVCRHIAITEHDMFPLHYGVRLGSSLLAIFGLLLACTLILAPHMSLMWQVAGAFYRTGALVFGGGHVVLPLLKQTMLGQGWMSIDTFLAGYGAAQAVPGPVFAVAAFLGKEINTGQGGATGALTALIAIFLPGMLLIGGTLPFWRILGKHRIAGQMLAGISASVVGLLASAFYDPLWTSTILDAKDFVIALVGFTLLVSGRWPVLVVALWCVGAEFLRVCLLNI